METEALLSALSDSQNLNKVLREENVRVREENTAFTGEVGGVGRNDRSDAS